METAADDQRDEAAAARAFAHGDVFTLERIHLTHGAAGLRGVDLVSAAARGFLGVVQMVGPTETDPVVRATAVDAAAASGHLDVVKYLRETLDGVPTVKALEDAAENSHWDVVLYLVDTKGEAIDEWEIVSDAAAPTETSQEPRHTTRVMDAAARDGRLDLVKRFHREGMACTTLAMDWFAANGHLEGVMYLHTNRKEGCTTLAMDEAAHSSRLDVVQFLHENRPEGCTTNAMDYAAANGDLALVRFLHKHRREGCTTNAVDAAAANGHVDVVWFLFANRSEGFTCRAVEMAAKRGCEKAKRPVVSREESVSLIGDRRHAEILRHLFAARPDLFDPSIMPALLLCGAFDVWLELRGAYPDMAGEEEAMMAAGERGRLSTIRFLCEIEGRHDLMPLAFLGAQHERPSWRAALYSYDPNAGHHYNMCLSSNAEDASLAEWWRPTSCFLESDIPDWMIEQSLVDYDIRQHGGAGDPYECKWTWPIWAIYRNDMATLELIHRLEQTADYMCDPMFSFENARTHAIRVGRLDLLQWLVEHAPHVAIEPTLLDDAIYFRRLDIIKWLAYNLPDACEAFPGTVAWPMPPLGVKLDAFLLDLLESDRRLRVLVDFGAMAAYVAEQGNLPLLERLFTRFPESVRARPDVLDRMVALGARSCDTSILQFLKQINYTHASKIAIDSLTSDRQVGVLRFLMEHFPHGDATLRGLIGAAQHGSHCIVLCHLQSSIVSDCERNTLHEIVRQTDNDWARYLSSLLDAQQQFDRLLNVEWASDSD